MNSNSDIMSITETKNSIPSENEKSIKNRNKETTQFELIQISKLPIVNINHTYNLASKGNKNPIVNDNFYNITNLYNLNNHQNSIFYSDKIIHGFTKNYRIREWLKDGFESLCGNSTICINNNNTILFENTMIKSGSDLQHELFVGIYCLNDLRNKIPNFGYILGGFKAKTYIEEKSLTQSLAPITELNSNLAPHGIIYNFENISHILYEKILPSVTFTQYCKNCTLEQFLNKYMQILYSLKFAEENCNFVHNNLNSDNILIWSKFKSGGLRGIDYEEIVLSTDAVAMIINYENSCIELEEKKYTYFNSESSVISDAYKLLLYCLKSMFESGNIETLDQCRQIVNFFNTSEKLEDILKKQLKLKYVLSKFDKDISSFILHIRKFYNMKFLFVQNDDIPILNVNSTTVCVDKNTAEVISMLKTDIQNTDIFGFYDSIICCNNKNMNPDKLIKEYKQVFLERIVKIYDYIIKSIENINSKYNCICIPVYKTYVQCFNVVFLELYKVFISDCLKLVESYYIITSLKQVLDNLFNLYPEFKLDSNIDNDIKEIQTKFALLTNYSNELLKFVYMINNPNSEQRKIGIDNIDRNTEFNWYFTDLVLLSTIIKNKIY
jgi:hypothetical protein